MIERDADFASIDSRLTEAAERGETLEVILVLRGKVRLARAPGRWRIRVDGRHVLTFRSESVVAATPIPRPPRTTRS